MTCDEGIQPLLQKFSPCRLFLIPLEEVTLDLVGNDFSTVVNDFGISDGRESIPDGRECIHDGLE